MSIENFKISIGDVVKLVGFVSIMFANWYATKMEIREQFLEAGFQKKINETRFTTIDNDLSQLNKKVNSLERKSQQVLFMLYRDADKPKKIEFKDEE
jgi:hypothetical protein